MFCSHCNTPLCRECFFASCTGSRLFHAGPHTVRLASGDCHSERAELRLIIGGLRENHLIMMLPREKENCERHNFGKPLDS